MANLVRYALLLAADLVIIGCVVHYCISMLYWHAPSPLAVPHPSLRTSFEKLKTYSYVAAVLLGFALALYGSLIFLFSWMPRRWVTYGEDGDPMWIAEMLAVLGAFCGTGALVTGLEKTTYKVSELQFRQAHAGAFEKLIERELNQFSWVLRDRGLAADLFMKLEHEIEEAEKNHTIYRDDARVCYNLLNTFRTACRNPG